LHRGFSIFPQTQPFPQALTAETSLEREVQRFQQLRHQAVARAKAFIEASTSFSPVKCGIHLEKWLISPVTCGMSPAGIGPAHFFFGGASKKKRFSNNFWGNYQQQFGLTSKNVDPNGKTIGICRRLFAFHQKLGIQQIMVRSLSSKNLDLPHGCPRIVIFPKIVMDHPNWKITCVHENFFL
jgi:hypothetical protein